MPAGFIAAPGWMCAMPQRKHAHTFTPLLFLTQNESRYPAICPLLFVPCCLWHACLS